ncbi:MAG: LamG domain-containing protein [Methylobacter sp.]|nr:MAG: LamG domain-containing protein [Methylobacter sp.]
MKKLTNLAGVLCLIGNCAVYAAPATGIVGNWHIDEENRQKLLDSSGYAKNARLGSTTNVDIDDPTWITRRFDTSALHFDGIDDFVVVPYAKNLEPATVSVEAWVRSSSPDTERLQYIVAKSGFSCVSAAYALYTGNSGGLTFYVADQITTAKAVESPDAGIQIWDGAWHHVVGTYDKTAVRLFVDGVEIGTGTPANFSIGYKSHPSKDLYIGDYDAGKVCIENDPNIEGTYGNSNFAGDIDEVRIWNRALTGAEVSVRALGD